MLPEISLNILNKMDEKIEGLIQTIRQAGDLLKKGMAEGTIEKLSYLYSDIQSAVTVVNQAMQDQYGICPEFNIIRFDVKK